MAEQKDSLDEGCGCLATAIGLPVLVLVGLVGSCVKAVDASLKEIGPVGVVVIVLIMVVVMVGIIIAVCNREPAEPVEAPSAEAAAAAHRFLVKGCGVAVLAELRWRPQGEPLVEFSCQRNAVVGGWQDCGLVAVLPVSEVLRQTEAARTGRSCLRIGRRSDEVFSFQQAYHLECWLLEQLAAGRPAPASGDDGGPDWTAAYGQMRISTLHIADVELRGELGDVLAVWHRDVLEGLTGTNGEEPGAVAASFRVLVDQYQQRVRRAEDACQDDPAALQDQFNALGTALLQRVERCLGSAQPEDRDGPVDSPGR